MNTVDSLLSDVISGPRLSGKIQIFYKKKRKRNIATGLKARRNVTLFLKCVLITFSSRCIGPDIRTWYLLAILMASSVDLGVRLTGT